MDFTTRWTAFRDDLFALAGGSFFVSSLPLTAGAMRQAQATHPAPQRFAG